jgi:hypothetical protein
MPLLPAINLLRLVLDFHRFQDTGDLLIIGNNITGDNLLTMALTPVNSYEHKVASKFSMKNLQQNQLACTSKVNIK